MYSLAASNGQRKIPELEQLSKQGGEERRRRDRVRIEASSCRCCRSAAMGLPVRVPCAMRRWLTAVLLMVSAFQGGLG
uniref:Uncharacterized protein n=1 Tax=Fagus sylvatica TaxID=28930 RepID=A0A2N9FYB3_FAGSY